MATFFHDGDPGCTRQNWVGCDSKNGTSCHSSDPASFAPTNLNVSQWIVSMKAIGAASGVITAKHGCGFLLFHPKTTTLPNGSAYTYHAKDDVAAIFAEEMTNAGLGHGFYYSLTNNFYLNTFGHNVQPASTLQPGQVGLTQAEYEATSLSLMSELWSNYGSLYEIWLDGGCGAMCDEVNALLATRPNAAAAAAFNGGGGVSANAVRWCGTEGGSPGGYPTTWSTTACTPAWCPDGSGSGSPPNATNASWYPSGVDATIQLNDHWFYTPGDALHSLKDLATFYHHSVGANGHLELDFAIDRTGNVAPAHAALYAQFGAWITSCYGAPVARGALAPGAASVDVPLPAGGVVDRVSLAETIAGGQFVISYEVLANVGGAWQPFSSGTTIGARKIDIALGGPVAATALRVTITAAFAPGHAGVTVAVMSGAGCAT